ncbi:MAG: shikimate dehydrogenase [Anaerolineae bacterium]
MNMPANSSSHPPFFHLGLVGYPLIHSLSPALHHAALKEAGLQGEYRLFPVPLHDVDGLRHLLQQMRHGEIAGLNVTIPHKQNVLSLLDELTPTAQAIGAVNTIARRGKLLIGHNTDAAGFLTDLQRVWATPAGIALVLGAGGAARAVTFALRQSGWHVWVAARRSEQAERLLAQLAPEGRPLPLQTLSTTDLREVRLIVNTTPLGMSPHIEQSPWPTRLPFPKQALVYDLIYNPSETQLMQTARAAGLSVRGGLGMLIAQAALAFEMWTGFRPRQETLFEAVKAKT